MSNRAAVLLAAAALLAPAALAGCSSVLSGDEHGVMVQRPAIGLTGTQAAAAAHCARFGKTAVLEARLVGNRSDDWRDSTSRAPFTPIDSYRCQ